MNCVYLKKDIDWLTCDNLNSFFDAEKRRVRQGLKNIALSSWGKFNSVVNSDKDPNNRIFHSTETCSKTLSHKFVIPMDDDDILLRYLPRHLDSLNENTGAAIWNCLEVDFVSGKKRTSFMLKQEDKPKHSLTEIIILPGAYALSNALMMWAIAKQRVGDLFNFFTALQTIKEGCRELDMEIHISDDTHCVRPYTSACEYYLSEKDIKQQVEHPLLER